MLEVIIWTIFGVFVYLVAGFLFLALVYYNDDDVNDEQAVGIILLWLVVLLIKVVRGILYLVRAAYLGIAYVIKEK